MKQKKKRKTVLSPQTVSFLALIIICAAIFGILEPAYLQVSNINSILLSAALPAVLSLGVAIVISAGGFDLSVGHVAGFATLMCGYFLRAKRLDAIWAILLAILLSVVIGFINGIIVSRCGINSFITTLSIQFVLVGLRQWITDGDSYRANRSIKAITQSSIAGISSLIVVSAVLIAVIGFIMQKTSFGRRMQFVGSNMEASIYNGIDEKHYTCIAFVLSGAIAGIVGVLQFSKLTSATINIGDGWLFNAMTIAVFSSVIFGKFKAHGIVLVAILVTMITTGINMMGVSSAWTNFVLGLILLAALFVGKGVKLKRIGKKKGEMKHA